MVSGGDMSKMASGDSYKEIIQTLPDIIYEIDPRGNFTYLNEAVTKLGYDPEELLGKHFSILIHPHDIREVSLNEIISRFKGKTVDDREQPKVFNERRTGKRLTRGLKLRLLPKNYDSHRENHVECEIYALGKYEYIDDEKRQFLGTLGMIKDVSERKLSEKLLLLNEKHYRNLMENITEVISIIFPDGTVLYKTDSVTNILGYEPFDLIGENEIEYIHPDDIRKFDNILKGKVDIEKINILRYRYMNRNGLWRIFETRFKKILDPESKTMCYICNSRDITEQIEAEDKLIMAMEMARAASRAKSEFLANISHEIRTPLNAILGFTQLLESMIGDEELSGYLSAIKTAGNSLLTLINDILDLSKVEAGKIELLYGPVSLKNLFAEIENIFSLKIKEKKIQYFTDLDRLLPSVIILDKARIRQVLFNVVGNAIKFTDKGFIKVSAGARFRSDDKSFADLIISVEDTGTGIPGEEQERIFESFVQRKGQNKTRYGGTGLGLSICKKLLDAMGGDISVSSKPGEGSLFTLTVRDVRIADSKADALHNDIDYSSISFTPATILVVTGENADLNFIKRIFSGTDVKIITGRSLQSAVEIIESLTPDIIIIDIRMLMNNPLSDKILNQEERERRVPLISILPSDGEMEKMEILPEYGACDGLIMRPFSKSSLYGEVSRFIGFRDLPVKGGAVSGNFYSHKLEKNGFPADSLELIPTMVNILEDEYMPLWEKYCRVHHMNRLREFGAGIENIGVQYSVEQLADYGRDLVKYADRFDIEKIKRTLEFFPEIIDTVKRLLDSR